MRMIEIIVPGYTELYAARPDEEKGIIEAVRRFLKDTKTYKVGVELRIKHIEVSRQMLKEMHEAEDDHYGI